MAARRNDDSVGKANGTGFRVGWNKCYSVMFKKLDRVVSEVRAREVEPLELENEKLRAALGTILARIPEDENNRTSGDWFIEQVAGKALAEVSAIMGEKE